MIKDLEWYAWEFVSQMERTEFTRRAIWEYRSLADNENLTGLSPEELVLFCLFVQEAECQ